MEMKEYEEKAWMTAIYPTAGEGKIEGLSYVCLGLPEEAGEVSGKLKKLIRDKGGVIDDEFRAAIIKELGDVLWYLTICAGEVNSSLEEVARLNNEKLASRMQRGTLGGSGDDR